LISYLLQSIAIWSTRTCNDRAYVLSVGSDKPAMINRQW